MLFSWPGSTPAEGKALAKLLGAIRDALNDGMEPGPVNTSAPEQANKRKVLLVDDHPLVRLGVGHLIDRQPDLMVCGQAEDAREAEAGASALEPDVVVLDLTLKGSDGLEVLKSIHARFPAMPVLVLSNHDESLYAELALRAGAKGYLMKSEPLANIVAAIRRVLEGGIYLSESMATRMVQQHARGSTSAQSAPIERLSDRERQVLQLIGQWHTTRQIANELRLSIKTVEHYREKLKAKLQLDSAVALVQYAVRWTQNPSQEKSGDKGPPGG